MIRRFLSSCSAKGRRPASPMSGYAAATKGLAGQEMTEMGLLADTDAVSFTDRPHHRQRLGAPSAAVLCDNGRRADHRPEAPDLVGEGVATEGETATRMGLPGIPAIAEAILLDRGMRCGADRRPLPRLPRLHGCRPRCDRSAQAKGLPVTCDTAPPYFALDEGAVMGYRTDAVISAAPQ